MERPLLALPRRELVAERLPRQAQPVVRHGAGDEIAMGVKLAADHPCGPDGKSVAIAAVIFEAAGEKGVTDRLAALLNNLLVGDDVVIDAGGGVGDAELHIDRAAVGGELRLRTVGPVVCECGRALVA